MLSTKSTRVEKEATNVACAWTVLPATARGHAKTYLCLVSLQPAARRTTAIDVWQEIAQKGTPMLPSMTLVNRAQEKKKHLEPLAVTAAKEEVKAKEMATRPLSDLRNDPFVAAVAEKGEVLLVTTTKAGHQHHLV